MVRWHGLVVLILLICLGGCVAIPFGQSPVQKQSVPVVLENSANQNQTFEVSVVEVGATVKIRRSEGDTDTFSVSEGLYSMESSGNPLTRVELPDSARFHGRFTLEPDKKTNTTITEFRRNMAVVVIVHDESDDNIRMILSANCGGANLLGFNVSTRPDSEAGGARSGYECG